MILTLALAGVTVAFPMEASVRGTEIHLGDIATVTGDDPELVEQVAASRLGAAPTPGYSRLFHSIRVEQLVERRTGVDVTFTGHRACRVRPVVEVVPPESITAEANAELRRIAGGADVELEPSQPVGTVHVPAGATGWTLRARLDDDALRTGIVSVPVRVLVDGEVYRTVWTRWNVSVYETRTVLGRRVSAGQQLVPGDFREERVEIARPGASNPLGRRLVVGAVAARDLSPSTLVSELDVHRPVAVRRGDTIQLQARSGHVVARVPATARQDASLGDRLVVVTSSGREMTAVVLSPDLVEVDLGPGLRR